MKRIDSHLFLGFTPGKVPGFSTAPMAMPNSARDFLTDWPEPVAPVAMSGRLEAWAIFNSRLSSCGQIFRDLTYLALIPLTVIRLHGYITMS